MSSKLHLILARQSDDVDCETVNAQCPVEEAYYGFYPSLAANVVFLVLFSFMWITHGAQGLYYRAWSTFTAMMFGCFCEVLGYAGRIMLHHNPYDLNGFLIQICCLTIAPAFYSAAIYLCLWRLIMIFGPEVSSLKPVYYVYIFIFCDVVSLALQGAGGGLASVAAQNDEDMSTGDNTQLAGLVFQVASLAFFGMCCAEYTWRVYRSPTATARLPTVFAENKNLNLFLGALGLSYTSILIRCIYRVIELAGGWGSELMNDERLFIVLEGAMIAFAVLLLNIFYPGQYLKNAVITSEPAHKGSDSSGSEAASVEEKPSMA